MEQTKENGESIQLPQPRLIPYVVSEHAKNSPSKIWGALPLSETDASRGYEDITFARLNYAISRTANWMVENIEPQRHRKHEALAYLGPPDSRYIIFAIAAIKAGFQMLFLSPRNSDEAQEAVIQQADCQKFLCSSSMESRIRKLLQAKSSLSDLRVFVVPEQGDLLKDEFVAEFPYERTIEEARTEPLVVLHTSSTTGLPKTVHLNQGYGMHEDIVQHVPNFNSLDIITRKPFYGDCRMFVAMPLFHAGGVLLTLLKSLYHDIVSVFQPPSAALNSEVFDAILRHGKCNGCVIPPYLLEDMLAVPAYFDTLASLKFVQFGSGPLTEMAGNSLLTRQKNCPHFIGSSECGLYILLELDDPVRDWQYFRFHPWSGIDMRPLGGDADTREMFIVRSEAPKIPGMQPVFELFPDLQEWPTKDLYVRHPTKPDHWRCIGRNDDVIVLSNGEKLNPVDTESRVANAHPSVTGALVIGQGQFAPGLLLEVRGLDITDPSNRTTLIDDIWPTIKAANRNAPGHGQLNKSLILFTSPDKPFLRTPKLSVRRKATLDAYSSEIEDMYSSYAQGFEEVANEGQCSIDVTSVGAVEDYISNSIRTTTDWEETPNNDDDLFSFGLDSLHVARLAREIKQALNQRPYLQPFHARMIYSNPTISALAKAIFELNQSSDNASSLEGKSSRREEAIEKLIRQHSIANFEAVRDNNLSINGDDSSVKPLNVILTGSTGSLGSNILTALLSNPNVGKIYCLNRSETARQHQLDLMAVQGVDISVSSDFDHKVHFLRTNSLSAPTLGLSDTTTFESLRTSGITHVIHNAWPVNFNMSLESFEPHIAGVHALIEFCNLAPGHPRLIYVSSLSSVNSLTSRMRVPEEIIFDPSAPSHLGYGESKYVAERILHNASEAAETSFTTSILRVGQIAGPVKGNTTIWPAREWFPSLVISSKTIGALPKTLGRMDNVDWVPVDLLADCISDLLQSGSGRRTRLSSQASAQANVYHVINPKSIPWSDLLPAVSTIIGVNRVVPLVDWIELVRNGPDETSVENPNPARKILPFYEELNTQTNDSAEFADDRKPAKRRKLNESKRFEVANMAKASSTFKKMGHVTNAWVSKWIEGWF